MAGYSAPGLLDGDYGYNSFWDNMSVGDMHELTLAPQHGDTGLVSALRMREQQNKELERQVKKYGEEEMECMQGGRCPFWAPCWLKRRKSPL